MLIVKISGGPLLCIIRETALYRGWTLWCEWKKYRTGFSVIYVPNSVTDHKKMVTAKIQFKLLISKLHVFIGLNEKNLFGSIL